MAERVLFIGWGAAVVGREERGLEVFNEAVGLYGRMQQEGRIADMNVVLLDPNGVINGFMELKGTAAQIADVREDGDFRRLLVEATLIVEDLRVVEGYCDEGIAPQMATYQEAVSRVPQQA